MNRYHRKSSRLKNHDYSQDGACFVTICTNNRECLFGNIVNNQIQLNEFGKIVCNEWIKTPMIRRNVKLDSFVVMPNHIHGIIIIENGGLRNFNVGATRRVAPTSHGVAPTLGHPCGPVSGSIGAIIGQFKSITTKHINRLWNIPYSPIWQRNYYEHIIRDGNDLFRIKKYINDNPLNWDTDKNNPKNCS